MFFLKQLPSQDMIRSYLPPGSPETALQIGDALNMMRRASLLVRQIDLYFAEQGLSQLKFLIMVVIDREPERSSLRQSEINARLDISKPVLHRTIQSLKNGGMLNEIPDRQDARARQIALTQSGREILRNAMPGYFAVITEFMKGYCEDELPE